jgi:hypothetical protein
MMARTAEQKGCRISFPNDQAIGVDWKMVPQVMGNA